MKCKAAVALANKLHVNVCNLIGDHNNQIVTNVAFESRRNVNVDRITYFFALIITVVGF